MDLTSDIHISVRAEGSQACQQACQTGSSALSCQVVCLTRLADSTHTSRLGNIKVDVLHTLTIWDSDALLAACLAVTNLDNYIHKQPLSFYYTKTAVVHNG